MVTVDEALNLVIANAGRQPVAARPLLDALNCVLAKDVLSDVDSPPFDKAMMDGYAVRSADLASNPTVVLHCIGEIAAGSAPTMQVESGCTARIMTGAPIPDGTDSVVIIERSEMLSDGSVRLNDSNFQAGQNVMARGREITLGQVAITAGTLLGPVELGVLATVGCINPRVFSNPSIAIVSTGDELVPPDQRPRGPQIRNSNESLLAALARQDGAEVRTLGIVRDDESLLTETIRKGLESDVLLLSGGVSAGKFDLVPKVLASLGVQEVFHKVQFKPGKPLWFGKHPGGLVFGLPGNPVSVIACYCLFVRTALNVRRGMPNPQPRLQTVRMAKAFSHSSDRLTYHPALVNWSDDLPSVTPSPWFGSPDLKALTLANAFLVLPIGVNDLPVDAPVKVLPFSERSTR